jgi:ATP-dependent DNA helicase RecQ
LSVFGLLRDAPIAEVRGYIDQLVAADLLRQSGDQYAVLSLTEAGVALMKDAAARPDLVLARQQRPPKGAKDRGPKRSRVEAESWQDVDRELFEHLRGVRLEIARSRGVPPYVVFHDTTLRELARVKPRSMAELRGVYGVGARKAEDLGGLFLEAIRTHAEP